MLSLCSNYSDDSCDVIQFTSLNHCVFIYKIEITTDSQRIKLDNVDKVPDV